MGLAVVPGDHACATFATDTDQAALVGRFARDAFARGDRVFYLADRSDEADVTAFLDHAGIDGHARLGAGDLHILHSTQMGLEDGFERDRQMAVWQSLIDGAHADGYRGLAVAVEMTWALRWGVPMSALIDYEATSEAVFASRAMSAVCQYDSRFFDPATIESAHHAHPYAMRIGGEDYEARYTRLAIAWNSNDRILSLTGEIDLGNVAFLDLELAELQEADPLVVDCTRLRFIDVAGCRLLHRGVQSGRMELRNPPRVVTRVMSLIGWMER